MPAASKTSWWRCLELSKTLFYSLHRRNARRLLSSRNGEKLGVRIPTAVSGWLMLRRAGLTVEQRQLV